MTYKKVSTAMWKQIGSVSGEHLPADQAAWLENVDSDLYDSFVEITEGDTSRQYAIDTDDIRAVAQLVDGISVGDVYGSISVRGDDTVTLRALRAVMSESDEERKGWWSSERDFSFEAR